MTAARIYKLEIIYPQGSRRPGWRPELWSDPEFLRRLDRKARRELSRRVFAWPRERMFLSSSGAYERAWQLRAYGAVVEVRRSKPVEWPDLVSPEAMTGEADSWWPSGWPEFDASGIPLEKPKPR